MIWKLYFFSQGGKGNVIYGRYFEAECICLGQVYCYVTVQCLHSYDAKIHENRLRRWNFCIPESYFYGLRGSAVVSAVIAQPDIKQSAADLKSLFFGKETESAIKDTLQQPRKRLQE